jgi:hypothetical protein
MRTDKNKIQYLLPKKNTCECGKEYTHLSGLSKHRRVCGIFSSTIITEQQDDSYENDSNSDCEIENTHEDTTSGNKLNKEFLINLIKENTELRNIIVEQSTKNAEQTNEFKNMMLEQNNKMMELVKTNSVINTTNNTTNNTQFNLNFFLNETCKNAMNIKDFTNSLQIDFKDLENVGHVGYIEGISNIIMKNLNMMDVHTRPFHCTDLKRETLYIKDENEWNKDTTEKTKLKSFIGDVANKNLDKINDWCDRYPESRINNHKQNEFYLKMHMNSLGGMGKDQQNKYDEKIIKNISKHIYLDKTTIV